MITDVRPDIPATERPVRSLGVAGVVFFVVAAAAPIVGVTGAVPVSIVLGNGAAVPGTFLVIGLVLLLFSVGYARMSRDITNAGAFFAYIAQGLGSAAGIGAALTSVLAYLAVQLAGYGFVGALLSSRVAANSGVDIPWWGWAFTLWVAATVLSALSVNVGAKILGALMAVELASLLVTAIAVFAQSPGSIDIGASFSPRAVFAGGFSGSAGIALAFAVASFLGFEATAIYAAESKDPDRTVGRATYIAVMTITAIFTVSSLGVVAGLGGGAHVVPSAVQMSSVAGVPLADPSAVLFGVAQRFVGSWMADLMGWLVVSSLFAGALAFQNCVSRYLYSLAHARVLPSALATLNKRGAPIRASMLTSAISAAVLAAFGLAGLDPVVNLFYWFAGLSVIAIILVEIFVCFAIVAYYRGSNANPWQTLVAPAVSGVLLILGLYLLASRFGLLAGTAASGSDPTQEAWALSPMGWILLSAPATTFLVGALAAVTGRRAGQLVTVSELG